jgi:hypothetical protein
MIQADADNSTLTVLQRWNGLDAEAAAEAILPCNGSQAWAEKLAALRPFETNFDLTCTADIIWRSEDRRAEGEGCDCAEPDVVGGRAEHCAAHGGYGSGAGCGESRV